MEFQNGWKFSKLLIKIPKVEVGWKMIEHVWKWSVTGFFSLFLKFKMTVDKIDVCDKAEDTNYSTHVATTRWWCFSTSKVVCVLINVKILLSFTKVFTGDRWLWNWVWLFHLDCLLNYFVGYFKQCKIIESLKGYINNHCVNGRWIIEWLNFYQTKKLECCETG